MKIDKEINSLLFVPAEEEKLRKISGLFADAFILDLEDAIKKENKENALKDLKDFLKEFDYKDQIFFVRLNSDNIHEEIQELQELPIAGYVIPKFEDISIIDQIKEPIGQKSLIALVETPLGLINLKAIVSKKEIDAIGFGAEDYCCIVGTKNEEEYLLPLKSDIVKYAHAYRKKCFDTISLEIKDREKIRHSVMQSKNIGFDGKLAIHPSQALIINDVYHFQDKEKMQKIIDAFEKSEKGVIVFEGKIYEKPHIEQMRHILRNDL